MKQVENLRSISKKLIEAHVAAAKDSNHPLNVRMEQSLKQEIEQLEKLRPQLVK